MRGVPQKLRGLMIRRMGMERKAHFVRNTFGVSAQRSAPHANTQLSIAAQRCCCNPPAEPPCRKGRSPSVHTRRSAPPREGFPHCPAILAYPHLTTALYGLLRASGEFDGDACREFCHYVEADVSVRHIANLGTEPAFHLWETLWVRSSSRDQKSPQVQ